MTETMQGIVKHFRSVGFPGSLVCVSAEAQSRSCVCVNKPAEPALGGKTVNYRGSDGKIFSEPSSNTFQVKTLPGSWPELKITSSVV